MRAGNVQLSVNGQTTGFGLVLALLSRQVGQSGSPDSNAQKYDDYLAGLNPPQTRPRADHDRDAELYRSLTEPSMNPLAQGLADYLQPKIAIVTDADQDVFPASTNVLYAPAGSLTATRTVRLAPIRGDQFLDGDFLLMRNDSSYSIDVTWQPPPVSVGVTPPPVALLTLAVAKWAFAMQIQSAWLVLAGS